MQFSLHKGVISSKFVWRMSKTVFVLTVEGYRLPGGYTPLPSGSWV